MAGLLHGLNGRNDNLWVAVVFAASYSIASAFVVYISQRRWLIMAYAVADGLGVLFYYFAATPPWLISVYFGLYTFGLVASTMYLSLSPTEMLKSGLNKKQVSELTGISKHKLNIQTNANTSNNRKRNPTVGGVTNKTDEPIRQRKRRTAKDSQDNTTVTKLP
jgi:hypothetical protein